MTENQKKVYEILKSNKGWMKRSDITLKGNFDKEADVTASLTSLIKYGYVVGIKQKLLDETTLTLYHIIKEYEPPVAWFVEICDLVGFNIYTKKCSSQTEALTFIENHKKQYSGLYQSRYHLYKGEEVGEY